MPIYSSFLSVVSLRIHLKVILRSGDRTHINESPYGNRVKNVKSARSECSQEQNSLTFGVRRMDTKISILTQFSLFFGDFSVSVIYTDKKVC